MHSSHGRHHPARPAARRTHKAHEEARSETADAYRQLCRIRAPCGDHRLRRESTRTAPSASAATAGAAPSVPSPIPTRRRIRVPCGHYRNHVVADPPGSGQARRSAAGTPLISADSGSFCKIKNMGQKRLLLAYLISGGRCFLKIDAHLLRT